MSKMIVIEGPDRVGKATQAELLRQKLAELGYRAAKVEVPIRTNFAYHVVYWMLRNGLAKSLPRVFQSFQFLNRRIFQGRDLPEMERYYDYVIMDRWSLSTVVYGAATGVSKRFTEKLYDRLRRPDHTFIILGPSHRHEAEDVYESDTKLQQDVRVGYSTWAALNEGVSTVLSSLDDREKTSREIISILSRRGLL